MKERQPGVDLVRCVGLLFVTGVHSFLKNGFYYEPQAGALMWAADSFRWLFFSCNGIFMLLTGYLKCEKPLNKAYYRSLLPILMGYLLTCVFSFPIRHFLLDEPLSLFAWVEKMVTFGNYAWYVEMYIGLFLFAPVINLALDALKEKRQLYWLAGTMMFLTALPSITPMNLVPDYWTALYPVTYYVLGAVIRKLQPKVKPYLALGVTALTAMGLGLVSILSTDKGFSDGYSLGYGDFWITVIVVSLFLGLYRVKLGSRTQAVLAWASGGVFEGYILSRLLDVWVYAAFPQWHSPDKYWIGFVCITIPIFVMSILAGKAVHTLAVKLIPPAKRPQKV